MHTNFWLKKTDFKLFGKTIFTREEICNNKDYEDKFYELIVPADYYKSEFEVKKKDDDNK